MTDFKKTLIRANPRLSTGVTADTIYWRSLKFPVTIQEFGLADCVDFSPDGRKFAVTSSVNVKVYSAVNNSLLKRFSKFSKTVFSARFRPTDGRLLCAGCEDHSLHVLDSATNATLRQFRGHQGAVRCCCFSTDGLHVASFSDDRSVALWDIGADSQLCQLREHCDYVRGGCYSPSCAHQLASGGYDHAVKVWDTRSAHSVMSLQHGAPVECLLYASSGSLLLSTGGTEVRVWDLVAGGRQLSSLSHHTKTVTCATFCCRDTRLLTGSLDRRVKVYETGCYRPVHTLDYCSPILSVALSSDDNKIVVGMSDGLVSVQQRKPAPAANDSVPATVAAAAARLWGDVQQKMSQKTPGPDSSARGARADSRRARARGARRQTDGESAERHDIMLRQFRHSDALGYVLKDKAALRRPSVAVAVIRELRRRQALRTALAGRHHRQVRQVCRLVRRHLWQPQLTAPLARLALDVVDVYGPAQESHSSGRLVLSELSDTVHTQLEGLKMMQQMHGMLDMLTAASRGAAVPPIPNQDDTQLSE